MPIFTISCLNCSCLQLHQRQPHPPQLNGNFGDYAPIRINEMPTVEVHIVQSAENPTGIGEPGVPPVAPAVANAIAAATGKWLTRLPFQAAA